MKKVGIFGWSSSLSHAGRMVEIARHLSKSYQVFLCGQAKYLESSLLVNSGEFELILHAENTIEEVLFQERSEEKEWLSLLSFLYEDIDLIQKNQFDIIIADHRKTSLLAAQVLNVTSVSITQSVLLGSYNQSTINLSRLYSDIEIKEGNIDLNKQSIVDKVLDQEVLAALAKLKIKNRSFERDLFLGDITIALDDHRIFPLKEKIPTSIVQLPPILFETRINVESKKSKINTSMKTILISKGGSGQNFNFEKVIRFLIKKKDVQLILLGFSNSPYANKENVIDLRYGPIEELMEISDLFISNGGSISLYQALKQGIRTCVLPGHLEQHINGLMFEKSNSAFSYLNPKNDKENQIIIENLIGSIDQNARHKRNSKYQLDSQQKTLDFITKIVDRCR